MCLLSRLHSHRTLGCTSALNCVAGSEDRDRWGARGVYAHMSSIQVVRGWNGVCAKHVWSVSS